MGRRVLTTSPGMQRIVTVLKLKGPLTACEIAEEAHVASTSLKDGGYLRRLKAEKKIHVHCWRRSLGTGGNFIPVYAAGCGKDAAQPPALTDAQKQKRYRSNPEVKERQAHYKRARRIMRTPLVKLDPLLAALTGATVGAQ